MVDHKLKIFIFVFIGIFLLSSFFLSLYFTGFLVGGFTLEVDPGIVVLDNLFREGIQSTDFLRLNDTQLASINDMTLEISNFGKVYFYDEINLASQAVDNIVYLDSNVLIAENYINVDINSLQGLNKSAIVFFYDLPFIDPGILRNGYPCVEPQCKILSYVAGDLIFNVSSFSYYSAYETYTEPEPGPTGGGSSGGGGGSSSGDFPLTNITFEGIEIVQGPSFMLMKDFLEISFLIGDSTVEYLEITNNGLEDLVLEFGITNSLKGFLSLEEVYVPIKSGETSRIPLFFNSISSSSGGLYVGSLTISAAGIKKTVNIIMEVLDKSTLFDVGVRVDKGVKLGDNVKANITIDNIGIGKVEVSVRYGIKSFEGELISSGEGIFEVEDYLSLERELPFPASFPPRKYVFFVEVKYGEKLAVASEVFQVGENEYIQLLLIIISIFLFLILILILYRILKKK